MRHEQHSALSRRRRRENQLLESLEIHGRRIDELEAIEKAYEVASDPARKRQLEREHNELARSITETGATLKRITARFAEDYPGHTLRAVPEPRRLNLG